MTGMEMWDRVAPAWERLAEVVDGHLAHATERMLELAEVGPGATVLELACGAGGAGLAAAARVGEGGRVVLSDVAPEMVAAAARRAPAGAPVATAVHDLMAIDEPDGSFDAVLCRHGLMFAPEPETAVAEVVRVLRPGGRFAAETWGPRAENPWLGVVLDAVGAQFGVPFPPPNVRGPFALDDAAALDALFHGAGLEDVVVERVVTPMRAASLEAWWEQVPQLAGPLAEALAGMEPEVRDAIRDRALASGAAAARESDGGLEFDGLVLLAVGRRPG